MKNMGAVWSGIFLIGLVQMAAGCSPNDTPCLQKKATALTNGYRSQGGLKPLEMPTIAQQNNAMQHSRDMMNAGFIYHQQLPMASEVGCGMWLTGENVAQTWLSLSPGGDHAEACMQLWRDSPPHFANIMSGTPSTMAYGYALGTDGKVYCTQTFGTFVGTPGQGGSCERYGSGGSPSGSPRPTPTNRPKPTKKPNGATRLRGYEFDNKPSGSRYKNSWKLPRGLMSTTIYTTPSSRTLEIRAASPWGSSSLQVMWDGKVMGTYAISKGTVRTINVTISHGNGKHVLRLDNRGDVPIAVRRART